jgi:F0F1-type ATP synthase assembly protein I
VITAAGALLLWLAYIWSFDVEAEADRAVGVSIGKLRFVGSDSMDVIGVLVIGFIGLFLVVLGVKTVISAFRGTDTK